MTSRPDRNPACGVRSLDARRPGRGVVCGGLVGLASLLAVAASAPAQDPPNDETPHLTIQSGGPRAFVRGLAFSPDGRFLYAAGWDKTVDVWESAPQGFVHRSERTLRIPRGDGLVGAIQDLALSADGRWLAVGGRGLAGTGRKATGWVWPANGQTDALKLDRGAVYVFDLNDGGAPRILRGHADELMRLAFVPPGPAGSPTHLVTAGRDGQALCWDVEAGRTIGKMKLVPTELQADGTWKYEPLDVDVPWPPTLVPWRTPAGAVQVAVSWESSRPVKAGPRGSVIYVWDVASRRVAPVRTDVAAARLLVRDAGGSGNGRVFVGGFDQLGAWDMSAAPASIPTAAQAYRLVTRFDRGLNPEAGAFDPGDPRRLFCAMAEYDARGRTGRQFLVAYDVTQGRELGRRLLWTAGPPARIAVSKTHVAIGGDADDRIHVVPIDGFLADRPDVAITLGSDAARYDLASFAVDANGAVGLLLETRRGFDGRAVVFDVAGRKLAPNAAGWKKVAPADGGWTARNDDVEPDRRIAVRSPQGTTRRIALKPDLLPTRFKFCPPSEHCPHPLLAVAGQANAGSHEPKLALYDAETGRELRWFEGHTGPIAGLAFSQDGGLIATCASDRTVRVWSLRDLKEVLDVRGMIDGLEVEHRDGKVVVAKSPTDQPALRPGDVVTHVVVGADAIAVGTPWDLYHRLTRVPPGAKATLRVAGGGGPARDVAVPVAQAVDVRKPLFSLFATDAGWIAWDEWGKFDASDDSIEQRVGWHFNTGEPGMPVRFAPLKKYRDEFRREKLVEELIRGVDLTAKVEPPLLSLRLVSSVSGDELPLDGAGGYVALTRDGQVEVQLRIEEFRLDFVQRVEIEDPRAGWRPMQPGHSPGLWIAALDEPQRWERGVPQKLRARVVAKRVQPPAHEVATQVAYQPPSPKIADVRQTRSENDLAVSFRVTAVEDVQLAFEHEVVGKPATKSTQRAAGDGKEIVKTFALGVGRNRISLRATNVGAKRHPEQETATVDLETTLEAPPAAPLIALAEIRGLDRRGEPRDALDEAKPTSAVAVRLTGAVTSATLESLEFQLDDRPVEKAGTLTSKDDRHEFAHVIRPGLGEHRVTITARSKTGQTGERVVKFTRVPFVELVEVVEREVRATADRPATARFTGFVPVGVTAESIRVVVNDEPHPAGRTQIQVGEDGEFTVALTGLATGKNRIQARVRAEAGDSSLSEALEVFYRRPPEIVKLDAPRTTEEPRVKLVATIASFERPEPERIVAFVNGTKTDPGTVQIAAGADAETWDVTIPELPLDGTRDKNEIRLEASNSHGPAPRPALASVQVMRKPPVQIAVQILSPRVEAGETVDHPDVSIEFEVVSNVPLDLVRLVVGTEHPFEVRNVQPGRNRYPAKTVTLQRGENPVQVHVTNPQVGTVKQPSQPLILNYVPRPVHVHVDRIAWDDGRRRLENRKTDRESGPPRFDEPAGSGRVVVHGRILGAQEDHPYQLKAWANGFLYEAVHVVGGEFATRLVLNRAKENEIRLEVVGLPDDEKTGLFQVDCTQPVTDQRLHLIVVGADVVAPADEKQVVQDIVESLQLQRKPVAREPGSAADGDAAWTVDGWKSERFSQVHWHPPHFGRSSRMKDVNTTFHRVEQFLERQRRSKNQPIENEVVLFYYKGFEVFVDRKFRLATIDYCVQRDGRLTVDAEKLSRAPAAAVLSSERLQAIFRQVRGAHLVFLDVKNATGEARDRVVVDPDLGVLRVVAGRPAEQELRSVVLAGMKTAAQGGDGRVRGVRAGVQRTVDARAGFTLDDGLPTPLLDLELVQP